MCFGANTVGEVLAGYMTLRRKPHQLGFPLAVVFSWPLRKICELITAVQCGKR